MDRYREVRRICGATCYEKSIEKYYREEYERDVAKFETRVERGWSSTTI